MKFIKCDNTAHCLTSIPLSDAQGRLGCIDVHHRISGVLVGDPRPPETGVDEQYFVNHTHNYGYSEVKLDGDIFTVTMTTPVYRPMSIKGYVVTISIAHSARDAEGNTITNNLVIKDEMVIAVHHDASKPYDRSFPVADAVECYDAPYQIGSINLAAVIANAEEDRLKGNPRAREFSLRMRMPKRLPESEIQATSKCE